MSETIIQAKIAGILQLWGWEVIRLRSTYPPNQPDLLALKKGRAIFIEVKQPGQKQTELQIRQSDRLRAQGFFVFVLDSYTDAALTPIKNLS